MELSNSTLLQWKFLLELVGMRIMLQLMIIEVLLAAWPLTIVPTPQSGLRYLRHNHRLERQRLIRIYTHQGYRYKTIAHFLWTLYGVTLSLKTLKRGMNLRRRGKYNSMGRVRHFILVSLP